MSDRTALLAAVAEVERYGDVARNRAAREFGLAFGVERTTSQRICLARLAGQRCTRNTAAGGCSGCPLPSKVMDHVAFWRREDERSPSVLTSQPYSPDLSRALQFAERFEMSLLVSRDLSWHSPASTTLLVFDRRGVIGE